MALTTEQANYIDAVSNLSGQDLLYEIAYAQTSRITADASNRPRPSPRDHVPSKTVPEYAKPYLESFLSLAQDEAKRYHRRLFNLLCNRQTLQPTTLVVELTSGTIKDVIAAVAPLMYSVYQTPIALSIPIIVLFLKPGLAYFCATDPDASVPPT